MKTKNNSTPPIKRPTKRRRSKWREEKERNGDYSNQSKVPEKDIKSFFEKFREFHVRDLDNPDTENLTTGRYCLQQGYSERIVRTWLKKYPQYASHWLDGKEAIGDKREMGMLKKRLSERAVMYTMHRYSDNWKDADKYHADLKNIKDVVAQLLGVTFDLPKLEDDREKNE